jgi:hypothetical protein
MYFDYNIYLFPRQHARNKKNNDWIVFNQPHGLLLTPKTAVFVFFYDL